MTHALNAINREFYDRRAVAFTRKRDRPWKGFERVLAGVHPGAAVLDVGCGHGRFARALATTDTPGLHYVGIDSSPAMLALAHAQELPSWAEFRQVDVVTTPPSDAVPHESFDLVVMFGLLHHIPGAATRWALLRSALACARPGGTLAVSLWRFDRSPRFARHRLDPAESLKRFPGLSCSDLEAGGALLDFDGQTDPPRYCHFPDADEIASILTLPGTSLLDHYVPTTGDRLNEYVVFRRLPDRTDLPGEPSAAC
ncbi:MAG: class I SAM-dependent methyltransferase [Myxococcales bacterium]|nr:class I SAM-dependent methyltransferase [Myxococcales bacterium]